MTEQNEKKTEASENGRSDARKKIRRAHTKKSNGYEEWHEYDASGNEVHSIDSNGYEEWTEYDMEKEIQRTPVHGSGTLEKEEGYKDEVGEFDTAAARMDLIKLMAAHYDGNDSGKKEVLLHGEKAKSVAETEGEWKLVYDSTNRKNTADFPHDWSLYVGGKDGPIYIHFCTAIMGVLSPGDMIMTSKLFPENEIEPLVKIISEMDPFLDVDMSEWKTAEERRNLMEAAAEEHGLRKEPGMNPAAEGAEKTRAVSEETLAKIEAMRLDDMKGALGFFLAGQNSGEKKDIGSGAEFLINSNVRQGNWVVVPHSFDREMNRIYPPGWTLAYRGNDVCECRDGKRLEMLDKKLSESEALAVKAAVADVLPGLLSGERKAQIVESLKSKAVSARPESSRERAETPGISRSAEYGGPER